MSIDLSDHSNYWQHLNTKENGEGGEKTPTSSKKFFPTQHTKKKDTPEISIPFSNFPSPHIATHTELGICGTLRTGANSSSF